MISAEAPILFAKACEMFIIEMTHKAYYYAKKNNRKTLQRNDIAAAITDTEIYDFLLDIMPRDEIVNNAKEKTLVNSLFIILLLECLLALAFGWCLEHLVTLEFALPKPCTIGLTRPCTHPPIKPTYSDTRSWLQLELRN